MSANSFRLQVVTPERVIFDGEVAALQLPASDGLMGVLPNHAPILTALNPGPVTVRGQDGKTNIMMVSDGFFEMAKNHARILADAGERAEDIDTSRAEESEKRARERLRAAGKRGTDVDFIRAERALQRAIWRLRISKKGGR